MARRRFTGPGSTTSFRLDNCPQGTLRGAAERHMANRISWTLAGYCGRERVDVVVVYHGYDFWFGAVYVDERSVGSWEGTELEVLEAVVSALMMEGIMDPEVGA